MGINLHLKPGSVSSVLDHAGCVFLLASDFHPMIAALSPLRRLLASKGQTSIFNLLGPLLNPAFPEVQLTGIFNANKLVFYAEAMGMLGRKTGWAVHGEGLYGQGGVDELSITGKSKVVAFSRLKEDDRSSLKEFVIDPRTLGFPEVESPSLLLGGDAKSNAARIRAILSAQESGPAHDMIVLNAAAALYLAGIGGTLIESIELSRESIASGNASRCLDRLREHSAP
jgi:anthranilate phosphoribosyltransferase